MPTEGFRGFPRLIQANSGSVLNLGHDRFLRNPFQFIIQNRRKINYKKQQSKCAARDVILTHFKLCS
jgi:hypothetical protein